MRIHLSILFLFLSLFSLHGATWYVSTTGGDRRAGRSWRSAFGTLERALEAAEPGDEIWLAAGCYEPHLLPGEILPGGGFALRSGVSLRGGFYGDESSPEQRRRLDRDGNGVVELWEFAGETVLRLPRGASGTVLDGQEEARIPTLLEGLTVTGGNAFGAEETGSHPGAGGGAYLRGRYQLLHCAFVGNHAVQGGGVFARDGVQVSACLFAGNTASDQGGALHLSRGGAQVSCSLFTGNGDVSSTRCGGALSSDEESLGEVAFCTFAGNGARDAGGTLYLAGQVSVTSSVVWESRGHRQSVLAGAGSLVRHCATGAGGFPGSFAQGGILLEEENAGAGGVHVNDNRPAHLHPCFLSPEDGDYRLGRGSCLIGRGCLGETILPQQDATGAPLADPPDLGCYASGEKANAAVELLLPAPLYFGLTQPLQIQSDCALAECSLTLEDSQVARLDEARNVTGLHAGTTRLLLSYVPQDPAFAPGQTWLPLEVLPRPLEVTAHSRLWIPQDEPFPALTWELTAGTLLEGHSLEGELDTYAPLQKTRDGNQYPICQGTLSVHPRDYARDYTIRFHEGILTVLGTGGSSGEIQDSESPYELGEGISLATDIVYGTPLEGALQLQGEILRQDTGEVVSGTFSWEREGETLPCGLHELAWTFQPDDESLPPLGGTLPVGILERELLILPYEHHRFYREENPVLKYLLSGFAPGEDESVFTIPPRLATQATQASPAGEYPIFLEEGAAPNYRLSLQPANLTVLPAPLRIQVDSATKLHGHPDPEYTWNPLPGASLPQEVLPLFFTREEGEAQGRYLLQGHTANPNYAIHNNEAYLEIQGILPVLVRCSSEPLEVFQTLRDLKVQYLMKDPETGEPVEGELRLEERMFLPYMDLPLTKVPVSLCHVFFPADADRYQTVYAVMVPAQMVHTPLSIQVDNQVITYGDPVPELTWSVVEGEPIPGVELPLALYLKELSPVAPDPLPPGTYHIVAQTPRYQVTMDSCYSPLTVKNGTLTVEKALIYLMVEDKEYTWGEPVPEPTCYFSRTPDGSQPMSPDLLKDLVVEFHVGEPDSQGESIITADGALASQYYRFQMVPGTLRCLPRLLTPQWPETLQMTFRGEVPAVTVTALPEELPEGTASLSSTCPILFSPQEEYPFSYSGWDPLGEEPYAPILKKEVPGRHTVWLASDSTGDYRFRWDTSVTGILQVGCETTLVLEGLGDGAVTRKLRTAPDDPAPDTITVIPGVNGFDNLLDALSNTIPGGTIWVEAGLEIGQEHDGLNLLLDVTLRRLHDPLWDDPPAICCSLEARDSAPLVQLLDLELRHPFRVFGTLQAENCTLNTVYLFRNHVASSESIEETPVKLEARQCLFRRDDAGADRPATATLEAAIFLGSTPPHPGIHLNLQECAFQWVQEKSGGYNVKFMEDVATPASLNTLVDWPVDLRSCAFQGWGEDSPEILEEHFLPLPRKDGVTYFLLPEEE
ncbi:MAG: MBG domain-containing protein [Oligosphaeraceae bacterium]